MILCNGLERKGGFRAEQILNLAHKCKTPACQQRKFGWSCGTARNTANADRETFMVQPSVYLTAPSSELKMTCVKINVGLFCRIETKRGSKILSATRESPH